MAAGDIALNILINASAGNTSSIVGQVQQALTGLAGGSGALGAIVGVAAGASAALIGVGVASTKAAADFQQTMNQVQALAGVSAKDAQAASDAIMKMSTDLGQSPKTLADGLYYIASAGYSAKDSLNLLELSTKAAAVGNTKTEITANALTAALKAFGFPASDAARIMDEMTKTVSTGKTEFEDYANVIGKISLNAKQAKVSFEEANAAFAILTNVMPSSKQAADSLNALLQTSSRIDLLTSRAKALGIQFNANAYQSMNFEQRLQYLLKITHGNQEEMTKLLGRQNAVAAATALATGNFADYNDALKNITNSSGALNTAWEKTSSGFNVQMGRVKASFDVLLISIGNQLLPVLSDLAKNIAPIIAKFAQWVTSSGIVTKAIDSLKAGLQTIGTFLGPIVNWFSGLFTSAGKAGQAMGGINGIFASMQPILKQIGDFLVATFKPVWDQLVDTWQTQVLPAWNDFMQALQPAMPALQQIGKLLGALIVVSLIVFIKGLALGLQGLIPIIGTSIEWTSKFLQTILWVVIQLKPAIDAIINTFQWLYDTLVGHSIIPDLINAIQSWFAKLPALLLTIMQKVASTLVSAWNTVVNDVKAAWQKISTTVSTAWQTYVATPLNTFFTNLRNWFTTNVVNAFGTWATNAMKMFAQNITAGVTNVTTAVTGVANTIKKLLGFASPPQAGPLATSNLWMPNMMNMLASGITQNTPKVTAATNNLANGMNLAFTNLNANVNTNVNTINGKLQTLNTNVTTQTNNASNQFMLLSSNVNTASSNINTQIATLNTNVSQGMQQVGSSSQQAAQQVSSSSSQIGSSSQQAAQQVSQASSSIQTTFGKTSQSATQTVQAVSQASQEAQDHWSMAQQSLNDSMTQFGKAFSKTAAGYGQEAGFNFTQGFQNMANAAKEAAQTVAAQISALLGHSKPKEGPLQDDDLWGEHMMQNIVGGMQRSMPALTGMTGTIAAQMASIGMGPRASSLSIGRSATPNSQPIIIHNYTVLDGRQVGKSVTRYQQKELHVQGGVRNK